MAQGQWADAEREVSQPELHAQLITDKKTAPAHIRLPTKRYQHTNRTAACSSCHYTDMKQALLRRDRSDWKNVATKQRDKVINTLDIGYVHCALCTSSRANHFQGKPRWSVWVCISLQRYLVAKRRHRRYGVCVKWVPALCEMAA